MTESATQLPDKFDTDIQKIEDIIQKYEDETIGLPKLGQMDAPSYLEMNVSELKKKSPEELSEAIISMNRYSLYIQRHINRNNSWINWAEAKLDDIASEQIPKIGNGYGWNERMLLAKTSGPLAKRINQFMREIKMKNERIAYIPREINTIAASINNLKFAIIQKNKELENV